MLVEPLPSTLRPTKQPDMISASLSAVPRGPKGIGQIRSEYHSHDRRCLCSGLHCITDHKGKGRDVARSTDELNTLYARFDANKTASAIRPHVERDNAWLTLETGDMNSLLRINLIRFSILHFSFYVVFVAVTWKI